MPATAAQFDAFAAYYDADYRHYDEDVDCILTLAEEAGGPVLELGCGTGRLLLPLAAQGHAVTGVDLSPALLAIAAASCKPPVWTRRSICGRRTCAR